MESAAAAAAQSQSKMQEPSTSSLADAAELAAAERSDLQLLVGNCRALFKHTNYSTHSVASIRATAQQFKALRGKLHRRLQELCLFLTDCDELHTYERKATASIGPLISSSETKHKQGELGVDAESKRLADDEAMRERWQRVFNKETAGCAASLKGEETAVDAETIHAAEQKAHADVDERELGARLKQLQLESEQSRKAEVDVNEAHGAASAKAASMRTKRSHVVGTYKGIEGSYRDASDRLKVSKEIKVRRVQLRDASQVVAVAESAARLVEESLQRQAVEVTRLAALNAANTAELMAIREVEQKAHAELQQSMHDAGVTKAQLAAQKFGVNCSSVSWQLQLQRAKHEFDKIAAEWTRNDEEMKRVRMDIKSTNDAIRSTTARQAALTDRNRKETQNLREAAAKLNDECAGELQDTKTNETREQCENSKGVGIQNNLEQIRASLQGFVDTLSQQKAEARKKRDVATRDFQNEQQRGATAEVLILSNVAEKLLANDSEIGRDELLGNWQIRELHELNNHAKWLKDRAEHLRTHPGAPFVVPKPSGLVLCDASETVESDADRSLTAAVGKKGKRSSTGGRKRKRAAAQPPSKSVDNPVNIELTTASQALRECLQKSKRQSVGDKTEAGPWEALPQPVAVFSDSAKPSGSVPPAEDDLQPLEASQDRPSPPKQVRKPPSVTDLFKDIPLGSDPTAAATNAAPIVPAQAPIYLSGLQSASEASHDESSRSFPAIGSFRGLSGAAPTNSLRSRQRPSRRDNGNKSKAKSKLRAPPVRPIGAGESGTKRRPVTQLPERDPKRQRRENRPPAQRKSRLPVPSRVVPRPVSPDTESPGPAVQPARLIRHQSRVEPVRKLAAASAGEKDPFAF